MVSCGRSRYLPSYHVELLQFLSIKSTAARVAPDRNPSQRLGVMIRDSAMQLSSFCANMATGADQRASRACCSQPRWLMEVKQAGLAVIFDQLRRRTHAGQCCAWASAASRRRARQPESRFHGSSCCAAVISVFAVAARKVIVSAVGKCSVKVMGSCDGRCRELGTNRQSTVALSQFFANSATSSVSDTERPRPCCMISRCCSPVVPHFGVLFGALFRADG